MGTVPLTWFCGMVLLGVLGQTNRPRVVGTVRLAESLDVTIQRIQARGTVPMAVPGIGWI